jgi:DNA-binding NarL/FixJ family response regulator
MNILITDDHPVVRRGLRQILEDEAMFNFIDEAVSGEELCYKMSLKDYDVILLDISMPGRNGLEMISEIKKINPNSAILILSIHSEELYAIQALKLGASGYLTKDSAPDELINAIHKVASGKKHISPSVAEFLATRICDETSEKPRPNLSSRESDVLMHLAEGKTLSQIAEDLLLSPKTVSTYRERLLKKLNLKTTSDLIRYAIMNANSFC